MWALLLFLCALVGASAVAQYVLTCEEGWSPLPEDGPPRVRLDIGFEPLHIYVRDGDTGALLCANTSPAGAEAWLYNNGYAMSAEDPCVWERQE